ncbi:hypothetical protein Q5H93_20170 [Hymenobacter sp. ASUV-10]|uniref:DUF4251 domain-containing protein n=1 Tax=Hymenobacter aranciens TaxID=3063996 RepID=A0ABT9BFP4_9BACT|nr:hypothetical protein [Hymenobacter sp. ASUV-10]MDO7877072.1 hypothetical protein [Hymenobacter sp. ASUV-10]
MKALRLLLLLPLMSMTKCLQQPAPTFKLPPATQRGANVIGFVTGGRIWRSYGEYNYDSTLYGNNLRAYRSRFGNFYLQARQEAKDVDESLRITLDTLVQVGTYQFNPRPDVTTSSHISRELEFMENYRVYSSRANGSTATLTITSLDTMQHIIAGTFSARLRSTNDTTTRVVTLSDGRFDVRYY